jgi:hypothetical protein
MKTTFSAAPLVRRFSAKAILGALFLASASIATGGCSADAQPISQADCTIAPLSKSASPAVRVSIKANAGTAPDVSIQGAGFPAGASVSIGYFGMPATKSDDTTIDLDFADLVHAGDDGTFVITQHEVYGIVPCEGRAADATISIAVGANGMLSGTTAPESFWCENGRTDSYGESCE